MRRSSSSIPAANAARFGELIELGYLGAQKRQHLLGGNRHRRLGRHGFEQRWYVADAPGRHNAELGGVAAYGIDQLRPLPDQQLAQ
jgi:hypothetical protein